MKRLMIAVVGVFFSLSVWTVSAELELSRLKLAQWDEELTGKLAGALLYAIDNKEFISLESFNNAGEIRELLAAEGCPDVEYILHLVTSDDAKYLYLIAKRKKDIIMGRHFRIPVVNDAVNIEDAVTSTLECNNLGKLKREAKLIAVPHPGIGPSEFHIMVAVCSGKGLVAVQADGRHIIVFRDGDWAYTDDLEEQSKE